MILTRQIHSIPPGFQLSDGVGLLSWGREVITSAGRGAGAAAELRDRVGHDQRSLLSQEETLLQRRGWVDNWVHAKRMPPTCNMSFVQMASLNTQVHLQQKFTKLCEVGLI